MSLWAWLLLAAGACLALKLGGHLLPAHLLERPLVAHLAAMVTAGLLAALVIVQTVSDGTRLVVDARVAAVAVAAVALRLRAPFIVVVILGAAVAAGVRALGWG